MLNGLHYYPEYMENVMAPKRCNLLPCTVRTSRQMIIMIRIIRAIMDEETEGIRKL